MDLSKLEAGKLRFESLPIDLEEHLKQTLEVVRPKVNQRSVELILSLSPDAPKIILGDPNRLRQVLWNLLSNAAKFTSQGKIELQVSLTGPSEEFLCFAVIDTGIGIPGDRWASIFERFTQADASTTREFGGTGLGLTICEHLAEGMDGKIELESVVGEGSTFRFSLPLAVPQTGLRQAPGQAAA